ncbi:MAG: VF530 family protein [Bacteroidota bacterium]
MEEQNNNPLHGKTLQSILEYLYNHYGWELMGYYININCFNNNPSIKSSLAFLRKTPWARTKVEDLYVELIEKEKRKSKQ